MRPFAELVEYWFGEREDEALEEHLFGCAECTARLEELAALGAGIRSAFRRGALHAVLPRAFVERLEREGLKLRQYRLAAGESVNCTITGEDDFVVSRLQAPLGGVARLDLVLQASDGEAHTLHDVPFDPAAGEVLVIPSPERLRARGPFTERARLVSVGAGGARDLGEYTFVHKPS